MRDVLRVTSRELVDSGGRWQAYDIWLYPMPTDAAPVATVIERSGSVETTITRVISTKEFALVKAVVDAIIEKETE